MTNRIVTFAAAAALSLAASGALAQSGGATGTTGVSPAPGSNSLGTMSPGTGGTNALQGGPLDENSPSSLGTGPNANTPNSGSSLPPNDTITPGMPTTNFGTGGVQPLPGSPAGSVPGNPGIGLSPTAPATR